MNNIYRKKSYTQYHIRQSIVDKFNNWLSAHTIMEHLNIWSTKTIYHWVNTYKKTWFLEDKSSAPNFLRKVIDLFPFKIEYILTDNWKEFSLKNHKWKYDLEWAFDKVCKEFDIEHRLTRPYTPKTNWMVEKANDTIKNWTINVHHYDTVEEMKQNILLFMIYYNLKRRHSWIYTEIRRKTPYEALEYYYNKTPDKFKETCINPLKSDQ